MSTQATSVVELRDTLARIADALGLPLAAFMEDAEAGRLAETVALVRAFDALRDPAARARCLAFARAEAEAARI